MQLGLGGAAGRDERGDARLFGAVGGLHQGAGGVVRAARLHPGEREPQQDALATGVRGVALRGGRGDRIGRDVPGVEQGSDPLAQQRRGEVGRQGAGPGPFRRPAELGQAAQRAVDGGVVFAPRPVDRSDDEVRVRRGLTTEAGPAGVDIAAQPLEFGGGGPGQCAAHLDREPVEAQQPRVLPRCVVRQSDDERPGRLELTVGLSDPRQLHPQTSALGAGEHLGTGRAEGDRDRGVTRGDVTGHPGNDGGGDVTGVPTGGVAVEQPARSLQPAQIVTVCDGSPARLLGQLRGEQRPLPAQGRRCAQLGRRRAGGPTSQVERHIASRE